MKTMWLSQVCALGILLGPVGVAHALNFCFDPGPNPRSFGVTVAQNFKKPGPGKCSPIHGFVDNRTWLATGTACLNSAGDKLRVVFSLVEADDDPTPNNPLQVAITLPYPLLLFGTSTIWELQSSGGSGAAFASAYPCIPQTRTIP